MTTFLIRGMRATLVACLLVVLGVSVAHTQATGNGAPVKIAVIDFRARAVKVRCGTQHSRGR